MSKRVRSDGEGEVDAYLEGFLRDDFPEDLQGPGGDDAPHDEGPCPRNDGIFPPEDQVDPASLPDVTPPVVAETERRANLRLITNTPPVGLDGDVSVGGDNTAPGDMVPDDDGYDVEDLQRMMLEDNPHFLSLGVSEGRYYYLNRKISNIVSIAAGQQTQNMLLSLAPLKFWTTLAPKINTKTGLREPDWMVVYDLLYREADNLPLWDPKREFKQGAIINNGKVVFNTGTHAFVDGEKMPLGECTDGYYRLTSSLPYPDPIFEDSFPENSEEILRYIEILKKVDWREDNLGIAVMTVVGYTAVAPICGILKSRPHIWMDGPFNSGKSWFMEYILMKALGSYFESVLANSTEPGIRASLDARSVPLLFDEAEGATKADKIRMDNVIAMARHTYSDTKAKVTHGVSGGGGAAKQYAIKTMLFLASIATRFQTSADRSRWVRISLGTTTRNDFDARVAAPAEELLTPDFSRRLAGRMLKHAKDLPVAIGLMTEALKSKGISDRVARGYAVFGAGAWFALRDTLPQSVEEAEAFITGTFGPIQNIMDNDSIVQQGRDHVTVHNEIMSHQIRIQTSTATVTEPIGSVMRFIVGSEEYESSHIPRADAIKALANMGIRPGFEMKAAKENGPIDSFLFSRQAPELRKILADTPYDSNYSDVMLQDPQAKLATTVVFPGNLRHRPVCVPLRSLDIDPPEDDDDEGDA